MGTTMRRELPYLHSLDIKAQDRLRELAVPRRYDPDATIFREGDRSDHVVIVTRGRVKVATLRPGIGEVVLAERGPGDMLGELSAIDGQPRSADAIALEEVWALSLLNEDFHTFLREQPGAAFSLLGTLAVRLRQADRRHVEFGETDGVTRIARGLQALAKDRGEKSGPWVMVPLSEVELAAHFQTSPEEVANALELLEQSGVIESHRRGVTIIDPDALAARAGAGAANDPT
jgi:CRP-like cAMP-binding protein